MIASSSSDFPKIEIEEICVENTEEESKDIAKLKAERDVAISLAEIMQNEFRKETERLGRRIKELEILTDNK